MNTVSLELCEYRKGTRVLTLASEFFGMPREFFVRSHLTDRVVKFTVVTPSDSLYSEDQWDGEEQIYRPVEHLPNVDYMVIYNQW